MKGNTLNKIYGLVFILIFGFELRTYLVGFVPITILTSIICAILALCGIVLLINTGGVKLNLLDNAIVLFIFLYGLRLFWDLFIADTNQNIFNNKITFIVYYVFLMGLPFLIGRIIDIRVLKIRNVLVILYFLYSICLIISFYQALTNPLMNATGRTNANEALDTIGYGHLALSYILISYTLFQNSGSSRGNWVYLVSMCFGVVSMMVSNSRSPFVALLMILLLFIFQRWRFKNYILAIVLGIVTIMNLEIIDAFLIENFNSNFIERFLSIFSVDSDNTNGRDILYAEGMNIFYYSPFIGKTLFVGQDVFGGIYVHNYIIEVLMSLGAIGFLLFFSIQYGLISRVLKLFQSNNSVLIFALLFIQFSMYLLFSRSLFIVPIYWFLIGIILSFFSTRGKSQI